MSPIGLSINLKDIDEATISQDIVISLSAPIINLIFSFVFLFIFKIYGVPVLYQLYMINLAVFIINIIPAFPLDGGRVLRDIIYVKKNYKTSVRITSVISIILGAVIIIVYISLLFLNLNNLSLLIIGIFIISSAG
jgi:stage IV sporulation protein FB